MQYGSVSLPGARLFAGVAAFFYVPEYIRDGYEKVSSFMSEIDGMRVTRVACLPRVAVQRAELFQRKCGFSTQLNTQRYQVGSQK